MTVAQGLAVIIVFSADHQWPSRLPLPAMQALISTATSRAEPRSRSMPLAGAAAAVGAAIGP